MTRSTWVSVSLIFWAVFSFISLEKASPKTDSAFRPAALAFASKAVVLYQPGVAVFVSLGARSKDTFMVSAPPAKAETTRDESPYPVDPPRISTRLGKNLE